MIYRRTKVFPPTAQKWQDTLKSNNLPQLFTPSSFNKVTGSTNADLVRLKTRSAPFVRDGINFTPTFMNPESASECFEGNAKMQWLDTQNYWCHLCQEPFSNASIHIGEREHQCMSFFVYLYSSYPHRGENKWSAKSVLEEATYFGKREAYCCCTCSSSSPSCGNCFMTRAMAKTSGSKYWMVNHDTASGFDDPIAALGRHVRSDPMTIEPSHLFTLDDVQRYNELESLITFAATRDLEQLQPVQQTNCSFSEFSELDDQKERTISLLGQDHDQNQQQQQQQDRGEDDGKYFFETDSVRSSRRSTLLSHILQSKQQIPLHSQGEKMFKETLSRMIVEMFPALSPVSHTQLSHKCWGRTNEEMLYCRLNLGRVQEMVGGTALTTKDQRAYMIRNMFWELIVSTEFRCDEDFDPVAVTIGREILRRMSFELIFAMTMHFMNRAQSVVEMLGFPDVEDLARYNSL